MLIKLFIDLLMMILMLMEMANRFTGNTFHEIAGISLFVLFIIHNILNRRWYKTIFRGKMNVRRVLSITVNLLFLVAMIVVMISAIPISRTIFTFMHIQNGLIARKIHTAAAYWGMILMAIHLGMHWGMIRGGVQRMMGITGTSHIRAIILRILVVMIVVYGVKTSFDRNVGEKLIAYYSFDFWESDESFVKLLLDYISIIATYVCGTYYLLKIEHKKTKDN